MKFKMAPDIQNTHVEIGSAEIYFAKKLANNDKKIREKALKKLKSWLESKGKSEKGNYIDIYFVLKIGNFSFQTKLLFLGK